MAFVFDIDGTLADNSHRMHLIDQKGKGTDWDAYHADLRNDGPIYPMIQLARALHIAGEHVILFTGRPERYRQHTQRWLMLHAVPHNMLLMREDGDYSKNQDLKRSLLRWIRNDLNLSIQMVFDDHPEVIKVCQELGIHAAHIPNPDYDGV